MPGTTILCELLSLAVVACIHHVVELSAGSPSLHSPEQIASSYSHVLHCHWMWGLQLWYCTELLFDLTIFNLTFYFLSVHVNMTPDRFPQRHRFDKALPSVLACLHVRYCQWCHTGRESHALESTHQIEQESALDKASKHQLCYTMDVKLSSSAQQAHVFLLFILLPTFLYFYPHFLLLSLGSLCPYTSTPVLSDCNISSFLP